MNQFQIASISDADGLCKLSSIQNVPEKFRFPKGLSYAKDFPDDAVFKMHDSFPKDVRLVDALYNTSGLLVVSARFKDLLESAPNALTLNEVLPVTIVNHKGRAEKPPYFIIHQLEHLACLDEKKSKGTRSSIEPKVFQFLDSMVLDTKLIPAERQLFRVAQYPEIVLVRRDLADALSEANLVGVEFQEIADYEF
jgi:hypothetical protein